MKNIIRVGMAQMNIIYGDIAGNLARAKEMAESAASNKCDILVLPECMDAGWGHSDALKLSSPVPGDVSNYISNLARNNSIYIVSGLTRKCGDEVFNSAVMADKSGNIILTTAKINVLEVEDVYSRGDAVKTVDTEFGRIGVIICADAFLRGGVICDALAAMGARIVLSPCAWLVSPDDDPVLNPYGWEPTYSRPAKEHGLPFIGVSGVGDVPSGKWSGYHQIGASLAMGRNGINVFKAPYGKDAAGMFAVDIALRDV